MARDVFISHASEDAGVAAEVCALLEARSVHCWIAPRDVSAGAVWDEAILDASEQSRTFLLILSKSTNDSQFVKNEVNRAFSQRKPIVTFRLEEVLPGRSLELYLARHHWTDAFPPPLSARVEALANSIKSLLDSSGMLPPGGTATVASTPPPRKAASRIVLPLSVMARRVRVLSRDAWIACLTTLLAGAAIAGLTVWLLKPSPALPPGPVQRFTIALPPGQQLAGLDSGLALAISPDGTHLAYIARQGSSPQQLYLRNLDRLEAKPIPGTEGATDPFFSPDSQWIGFFAGAKLKKVSVNGGTALTLGDAASPNGASWDSHGIIAFVPGNVSVLQQMSDAGSAPTKLSHLDKGENSQRWPAFLPNGKAVLFTAASTAGNWINAQVAIITLGSGERRNLIKAATQPSYALSGHLVYAQSGSLMAVPFDSQRLAITGTPVPVVDGVLQSAKGGVAQYSLSSSGSLIYLPGELQSNQYKLVWVNRSGVEQTLPTPARAYVYPRLSPNGKRLAIAINDDRGAQIWLNDLGESLTRVTFGSDVNSVPVWTPDGKRIAFTSNREGQQNIFWQLADGSGGVDRLTRSDNIQAALSFTPDEQQMAFIESNPKTDYDVWTMHASDHKVQPFLQTVSSETAPELSPDGHWLAYVSNESGRYEIYVQPFPGPGGKWQISSDGGTEPVWNRNGRELFYRSGDKMMAVVIATQPGFTAGEPRMLFAGAYEPTPLTFPDYDVSPDGQRFLMLKTEEDEQSQGPVQINVVLNWFEELKRRVPTGTK